VFGEEQNKLSSELVKFEILMGQSSEHFDIHM
jgi:hypothetical protein